VTVDHVSDDDLGQGRDGQDDEGPGTNFRRAGGESRQAFVENLVRASLGGMDRILWPEQLIQIMADAIGVLETLQQPQALVEDSAEATLRLYRLAESIPNIVPEMLEDWVEMGEEDLNVSPMSTVFRHVRSAMTPSLLMPWMLCPPP